MPEKQFWRTKLAALLHDPPDKCLNILGHEQDAVRFQAGAGLTLTEMYDSRAVNAADVFTAAADRFSFPKGKCSTYYENLAEAAFKHPLSSDDIDLKLATIKDKFGEVHGILQSAINGIDTDDPRTALFLYWRRWLENAVRSNSSLSNQLAFLPADTRIPDHTIWQHNAMASALAGCIVDNQPRPALLLLQMGGVQEFIGQARTTRDLWSGSYLLSWLMAAAMKAISDEIGPDAIVFPNLRGNGIYDAMHKDTMYAVMYADKDGKQKSLWERMLDEKKMPDNDLASVQWLTTPTLPNRFLAVVPADRAVKLAQQAAAAITDELVNIGEAVWQWLAKEAQEANCLGIEQWKQRWDAQLQAFPQVSWAVQPWLKRDECLRQLAELPANQPQKTIDSKAADTTPLETLINTLKLAEEWCDAKDRDPRYFKQAGGQYVLNNDGVLWSAHYALLDAKLAARRNTRNFAAWNNPWPEASLKDSLSGKEEIIGDETFWSHLVQKYGRPEDENLEQGKVLLFPARDHKYGAMNLIKRLWCNSNAVKYLQDKLGLDAGEYNGGIGFASTQQVSKKNLGKGKSKSKYIALLSMDGDEMGKWVSGQMTPKFLDQLSDQARDALEPILRANNCLDLRRLLSPSYHLQFSETLANVATWLARPIVEHYGGQLIYAGGDDVLAMLPATRAIDCARALRAVFRCENPDDLMPQTMYVDPNGYVTAGAGYPLLVPGARADVSVGLAIGHEKAPLQMLVQEAQIAEKRAKQQYGRGAIAFSLYKRSGEIIKWGCKWDSKALELMQEISRLDANNVLVGADEEAAGDKEGTSYLSERFPYALAAFLQPYQLQKPLSIEVQTMRQIITREIEHVLSRQGRELQEADKASLREKIQQWLSECAARAEASLSVAGESAIQPLADFIQPFLTEAFIYRDHGGEA